MIGMNFRSLCLIILVCVFAANLVGSTTAQTCESQVKGGKYKWAGIDPTLTDPGSYFGFVLVRSKDIDREYIIKLAHRLKDEYCKAQRLQVVIFDNRKHTGSDALLAYQESNGRIVLMRGFYAFDRTSGRDVIEFSTKLGNPTTEVTIDLQK